MKFQNIRMINLIKLKISKVTWDSWDLTTQL